MLPADQPAAEGGSRMLAFVVALFVGAALMVFIWGGWSLARYARLLAWSALGCWILALALLAGSWTSTRSRAMRDGEPGRSEARQWARFFFLAGMPPFAGSALLDWASG